MTSRIRHRGFTLIEVLLSTFVIALGVLGLLALFAGAAKQQQVSSNETAAVFAARGAQGALADGFGSLQFPTGVQNQFTPGVWYRLTMSSNPDWNFLTVNPNGGTDGPYFLVPYPGADTPLYLAPPRPGNPLPLLPTPNHQPGFVGAPSGEFSGFTFALVHRRIQPDSIRVEVVFSRLEDDGSGNIIAVEQPPLYFYRVPGQTYATDNTIGSRWILTLDGERTQDPADLLGFGYPEVSYLYLEPELSPGGLLPARITDMHIGKIGGTIENVDTGARIERVTVRNYQWRNDQLVSLDDRLKMRSDPSAPNGRRADQTYSVLFRRTPGGSQAMTMAYQLTAPSATAQFVPPETQNDVINNRSPIKSVSLYLHRDQDDPQQQYFRVSNPEDLWAIAPGQLLLIAEGTVPGTPGADKAVKVIRQVRETASQGNQWRGYVDRMPRIYDIPAVPPGATAGVLYLNVLAVADSVTSRADGSVWSLTPLLASEFNVDTN